MEFKIGWWMYSGRQDDYVDYDETVEADSEQNAIKFLKQKYPRGKNFKVWPKKQLKKII